MSCNRFLRFEDPFVPYHAITCQFQALFNTFPGLLFSFRSRYYYAIGFGEYLVLEVDDPRIHAGIPTHVTQEIAKASINLLTGLSPSMVLCSSKLQLFMQVSYRGPYTTSPLRIRFELCRVRSPLLTTSRLVSSPAPTKMFQFGAFPFR